jgi:hypothetical protein
MNIESARNRIQTLLPTLQRKPAPLNKILLFDFPSLDPAQESDLPELFNLLLSNDPNEPARVQFGDLLRKWDNSLEGDWIQETKRNTTGRRELIYKLLEVDEETAKRITDILPFCAANEPLVVSDTHLDWYHPEQLDENSAQNFYWTAYSRYLRAQKSWSEKSILELDNSTQEIVSRLANPEDQTRAYKARGLVMGYVQSGKTANFTGVIAKAADAGYRLVIVLGGTWNMLRSQTQRRIDKELIGKEMLDRCDDYENKPEDWEEFLEHSGIPQDMGFFNCERLTGTGETGGDYKRLRDAIGALNFQRLDDTKPFNHPINLHRSPFRLIVIKKIPSRLNALIKDLTNIRERLEHVPTLIIDDESDQAGVNTKKPTAKEIKERTATNRSIVTLLKILPLGQYVGYTATPYANYLIDPEDEEDLFPRHFILPLDRPDGYMGISDFFDPDIVSDDIPEGDFSYKERAFVRDAHDADHGDYEETLKKALGSFILAGAVKLYRQDHGEPPSPRFKHHTMLLHSSHRNDDHTQDEQSIKTLYRRSAFTQPAGLQFLEKIWLEDFLPVIKAQGASGAIPNDFSDLYNYIGDCTSKLERGQLTRILNSGDRGEVAPDFNRDEVWEIIVGGNKLSRGYTVEGLTTSYYLRRSGSADTLMQMGRWFGFRHGYRDLVRIYIGRSVGSAGVDLVDSFKQACAMEERSREDIRRYARNADGSPLRPIDVPPLISISGNLPPTGKTKMWNAVIKDKNFKDLWVMPVRMPEIRAAAEHNSALAAGLWSGSRDFGSKSLGERFAKGDSQKLLALVRECGLQNFAEFLKGFKWIKNEPPTDFHLMLDFLTKANHGMTGCLLVAPQLQNPRFDPWEGLTVKERKRMDGEKGAFQGFGEPKHRAIAEYWTGRPQRENAPNPLVEATPDTRELVDDRRMVCLLYPVKAKKPDGGHEDFVSIGFEILFPDNDLPAGLTYSTRVKNNNPVVDADEVEANDANPVGSA